MSEMPRIPVRCRTNLDLRPGEKWPEFLPSVPVKGDVIYSATRWRDNREPLSLVVAGVTYKHWDANRSWCVEVELGLPSWFSCISDFEDWYAHLTGHHYSSRVMAAGRTALSPRSVTMHIALDKLLAGETPENPHGVLPLPDPVDGLSRIVLLKDQLHFIRTNGPNWYLVEWFQGDQAARSVDIAPPSRRNRPKDPPLLPETGN